MEENLKSKSPNVTRGYGLLEPFLSKLRSKKANSLISPKHRRGRILDLGCGSHPLFLISTKFKEKHGIDPFLITTTVGGKKITLKNHKIDSGKLSFPDSFFDVVTMLAVFEHIENSKIKNLLKEIKRVLKDGGVLVITTPAPWSDKILWLMSRIGLVSKDEINDHKHSSSRESILRKMVDVGFDRKNVNSGFFEFYCNMWFTAQK